MADSTKGLYGKYDVQRVDNQDRPGRKHHGCDYFVLDLTHDKFAEPAIRAYASACATELPKLSADLEAKAKDMREAGIHPEMITEQPPGSIVSMDLAPRLPFAIMDQELKDLRRFHECVMDGEGYDVPKERMHHLAEIGLVRRCSANYYEATVFGLSVLNGDFDTTFEGGAA